MKRNDYIQITTYRTHNNKINMYKILIGANGHVSFTHASAEKLRSHPRSSGMSVLFRKSCWM